MAGIVISNGVAASSEQVINLDGASKVTPYHPYLGSNGAYRLAASTGLLTVVAAATATAGHIFAFRWSNASKLCLITNIRARWITVAGFTAGQEVGLDIIQARVYGSSHSGGTALTLTGDSFKKRSSVVGGHGTTNVGDIRISTTGALTAVGSPALDGNAIAAGGFSELAAAATVPKGFFEVQWGINDHAHHPIVLGQNQGFIVRNSILMGAGGTARVTVEVDWLEVDSY